MKVKQLIKKLQKCNPEAIVLMSSDMEGNRRGELDFVETNVGYNPDEEMEEFQVRPFRLTPQLQRDGWTKDDLVGGREAICLYPNM